MNEKWFHAEMVREMKLGLSCAAEVLRLPNSEATYSSGLCN